MSYYDRSSSKKMSGRASVAGFSFIGPRWRGHRIFGTQVK